MQEQLKTQLNKSKFLRAKLDELKIDTERIENVDANKVVDEYGRVYLPKEHHGPWRRRYIDCQNSIWSEVPMTILGILCLFFIPLFQYCHELHQEGVKESNEDDIDKALRLTKIVIWINFIIAVCFLLEVIMKAYAFGLRRAYV